MLCLIAAPVQAGIGQLKDKGRPWWKDVEQCGPERHDKVWYIVCYDDPPITYIER